MHLDEKTMPGIYNANDLCAFAFAVNNNKELRPWQTEDGKIHLKADINLLDIDYIAIGSGTMFRGVFDGEGHVISNITIRKKLGAVGLFGNNGGMIKNVHVRLADIESYGYSAAGGIAGSNQGVIMGCSFEGRISMGDRVGGIVGENYGSTLACYMINMYERHCHRLFYNNYYGGIAGQNTGNLFACFSNYFQYRLLHLEKLFQYGIITGNNIGKISHCYWLPSSDRNYYRIPPSKDKILTRGIGNSLGEDMTICTNEDVTDLLNSSLDSSPVFCEYKFSGKWPDWKFEKRTEEDGVILF